ncbi:MAG: peptide deformylase [Flavobacteriaceae bacterium]
MILPIVAYGSPVLKQKAAPLSKTHEQLSQLIENMWETMYAAHGVGLAAPQVGFSLRLFVVDAAPFAQDETLPPSESAFLKEFKRVFINPVILKENGTDWAFNEGCLSIPDVREDVIRKSTIEIEFEDEQFQKQRLTLDGLAARVVQHEYDHIEGILFTDHLSPLKKRLLKGKLNAISKGKCQADYAMRFPSKTKR